MRHLISDIVVLMLTEVKELETEYIIGLYDKILIFNGEEEQGTFEFGM